MNRPKAKETHMPVTKTLRECYEIRDGRRGGEWANLTSSRP